MSRSKKWRLEWAFFLGENGRRKYNKICKGCVHPCKQSFRVVLISCPHYHSPSENSCFQADISLYPVQSTSNPTQINEKERASPQTPAISRILGIVILR